MHQAYRYRYRLDGIDGQTLSRKSTMISTWTGQEIPVGIIRSIVSRYENKKGYC